ncbi:glycosyltransferase family 4 protein [Rhodococcoides kyotonense]|uniref:Glycosyltransferase involved in cell wall bisynthesis n=1 Tax=Rhodococcoides kyotonense TaxID=398843 RepID=A0A239LKK9_9NOCA|nr:glycosyltransferase family 4 protein [Rhodococcus kyotonensis]SNT30925.1 Glycosyltransferase involved in cell wall bisynthesis [Rhodococcus kyotonensis]
MKVLWLSPWMRPLARIHVEALRERGDDVMLVTTDQHPESDAARPYEVVLDARFKQPRSWLPFAKALRGAREFAPDVVVTELVRDPRWIAFGALAPRVQLIHDDRPHDASEHRPTWERTVFDRWGRSSSATVTFSEYVADAVRRGQVPGTSTPVRAIPLTSDLEDARVSAVVPADARRDFVLLGRINSYKNIDVVLEAWRRHVAGPGWRGDDLVVIGKGSIDEPLPPNTVHRNEPFRYDDELGAISRAKASLAHYRRASQSGVQVLSMQLGVATIVSDRGALPEFQTPGEPALGVDDVDSLIAEFDRLANPDTAFRSGVAARRHYDSMFSSNVVGARLHALLADTAGIAPDPVQARVPGVDVES